MRCRVTANVGGALLEHTNITIEHIFVSPTSLWTTRGLDSLDVQLAREDELAPLRRLESVRDGEIEIDTLRKSTPRQYPNSSILTTFD